MKKVKYNGTLPALLPTLGLEVKPGDVIDVPDEFSNALFEDVTTSNPTSKSTGSSDSSKEANK